MNSIRRGRSETAGNMNTMRKGAGGMEMMRYRRTTQRSRLSAPAAAADTKGNRWRRTQSHLYASSSSSSAALTTTLDPSDNGVVLVAGATGGVGQLVTAKLLQVREGDIK